MRLIATTFAVAFPVTIGVAVAEAPGRASDEPPTTTATVTTTVTVTRMSRYHGRTAARWAARFRHRTEQLQAATRAYRRLRRVILASPTVGEAIALAGATYVQPSTLWRKARCESQLDPRAQNGGSGSAGLFQFLPSTWRTTPYAGFSIWSPYANALAAGWMHAHGRGSEWVCQ